MEDVKLTIRLPKQDVAFAKTYAQAHGMTVTQFIDRYLRRMRSLEEHTPSPELEPIIGLIPADIDAEAEYRSYLLGKHGA